MPTRSGGQRPSAARNRPLRHGVTGAICGPTGRYRRNLRQGLAAAGMLECVVPDAILSRHADIIGSVPGCGRLTAACLCADMPELGTLGRRQAASLPRLAPAIATPDSIWAAVASAVDAPTPGESFPWRPSPRSAGSPAPKPATGA